MKKIICLILVMAIAASLCGCGNMGMRIGNFNFTHAHIGLGDKSHCISVAKWIDSELGVELKTGGGNSIFCAEGTYLLFENSSSCPFCN